MELRHIEQIVAICNAGSFSAAAERLGISQPTLSKNIARIEEKLGLKLFERTTGSARPTIFGAYVAEHGQSLLQGVSAIGRELVQMARGEAGLLRIAVGPATRLKPVPDVVRKAVEDFPQLRIFVRYASPAVMMRGLRLGTFDVAFCHREVADARSDFIRVKIFEDRYVTVARPDHPALGQGPLTPAALLRYPLASAGATPDFQAWIGDLTPDQAANLEFVISDDYDLLRQRPHGGDYVARGPRFVFEHELAAGSLVELPLARAFGYECWMLTTPAHWRSPLVKAVAQIAKGVVRE